MYVAEATLPIDQGAWASSRVEIWAIRVFVITLLGNALAAYNVGPFPIPWFAQCLPLLFVVWQISSSQRLVLVPGLGALGLFLIWAAVITGVQAVVGDYSRLAPSLMTVPYPVFLFLRFLGLLAVGGQVYLTYWLLVQGRREEVLRIITVVGGAVAVAALYIYMAQTLVWWEPPRTRMGTGGGEQTVVFSYAFHRAVGTFREPSHLAEWLMTPFFLSFVAVRAQRWCGWLIGLVMLLTGSLTGILGSALGLVGAMVLLNPLRWGNLKTVLRLAVVVVGSYLLFTTMAVVYSGGHANLLQVIRDRVEPILEDGGLAATNREYCYQYFAEVPFPALGQGLGNANLVFSDYLGSSTVAALLSLYYNLLYATGYVGFGLFLLFLLRPILETWRGPKGAGSPRGLAVLAAYCSWLVTFGVHSEELTIMFATVFALACYEPRSGQAEDNAAGLASA